MSLPLSGLLVVSLEQAVAAPMCTCRLADAGARVIKVRCYIGEPGGYGMGIHRPVFYSNVAAPRIQGLFQQAGMLIEKDVETAAKDKLVKAAVADKHIARRLEKLRDFVSAEAFAG
jgi:CoA transferase family III